MAITTRNFDVKINVVFPHITKSMPQKDSERIQQTTFFKYEPQKTVAESTPLSSLNEITVETNTQKIDRTNNELEEVKNRFLRLEQNADNAFKNYAFKYDILAKENEALRNAEEAIFGVATGIITQAKYKKILDLISAVDSKIVDLSIENGGSLNVVG